MLIVVGCGEEDVEKKEIEEGDGLFIVVPLTRWSDRSCVRYVQLVSA